MDFNAKLTKAKEQFLTDVNSAPSYSQYSRLLKRRIPGKNQVRQEFIDRLQDLQLVCEDEAVNMKIDAQLKKITAMLK